MIEEIRELGATRVWVCCDQGPCLAEHPHLTDMVGELLSEEIHWVAIPVERLGPEFLRLSSGVAGEVLQKFVNYRRRVALVGDVSRAAAVSAPLADFIRESNRGRSVWFVADLAELEARLAAE